MNPLETQALYDLSPLWRVMLTGAVLATAPLIWLWWRNPSATARLQALSVLTLFLTFDLVLFGAFTRLTDSGLGCPDWPGCYGTASPLGASAKISAAQAVMPTGPVSHAKAWIEMLHRYLATAVGALIVMANLLQWRGRRSAGAGSGAGRAWAAFTLFWVCLQGAFGALTVTMKLFPAIVTLHLLAGIVLLALLTVQSVRLAQAGSGTGPTAVPSGTRSVISLVLVLVGVQLALGGWVSTNYAVLACSEFPQCQGRWWPLMDFAQGFSLWRELGLTGSGSFLGFEALTAIHYAHRLFAYPVFLALGLLVWQLRRLPALRQQAHWLGALALAQIVTGLSNVMLDWPLATAVAHTGGAAALTMVLVWSLCVSRAQTRGAIP